MNQLLNEVLNHEDFPYDLAQQVLLLRSAGFICHEILPGYGEELPGEKYFTISHLNTPRNGCLTWISGGNVHQMQRQLSTGKLIYEVFDWNSVPHSLAEVIDDGRS